MTTLLLHGLGADRRQSLELFAPAVRAVFGEDELMVSPDVRAHGASTAIGDPADFALDRLADEVVLETLEAADAAGRPRGEPVTVMGLSMGAAIALRIALRGLLPIERAVFVRPAFGDRSLPPNLRPFPVIGEFLRTGGPAAVDRFRETSVFHAVDAVSPSGGLGLLSQFAAPAAAARAIRLVEIPRNRAFDDDAELAGLAARGIRSLVIAAPRDPVHPLELGERWAGGLGAAFGLAPARDDGPAAQQTWMRERIADWLGSGA
ncbi:alpha/beta fold hydrolase [Agromyces archimandritae]|uniref:Alpha/beta hydrolase n=1 Tax=Agromyces archimandritae TaxID=2781962 RepID=A0A975IN03_9MICO|nr:alpha/beta fold hydrolase [Agromyces archimandritae]QTX03724.1 alpha/beta hydrolase [Agromyces archimandritae]